MSRPPVLHRPTLRLHLVKLPSKLRPLHETTFPVRPRTPAVLPTPSAVPRKPGATSA